MFRSSDGVNRGAESWGKGLRTDSIEGGVQLSGRKVSSEEGEEKNLAMELRLRLRAFKYQGT